MLSREVSIVIFYDEDKNIILQERGIHSKNGEKYGFFGGGVEANETPSEAIKRELIEELNYIPEKLEYWTENSFSITDGQYKGWLIRCHVFLSPITQILKKSKLNEGKQMKQLKISEAVIDGGLDVGDRQLLHRLNKELDKRFSAKE